MNLSEGRGNEGAKGLLEVVWNDLGNEAAEAANWGGQFDGIRSDEDFRRALAIDGVVTKVEVSIQAQAPAKLTAVATPSSGKPLLAGVVSLLSRAARAMRATVDALSAWRSIRLPMR